MGLVAAFKVAETTRGPQAMKVIFSYNILDHFELLISLYGDEHRFILLV